MGSWHSNTSMAFERSFSMEIRDATHINMTCVLDFVENNLQFPSHFFLKSKFIDTLSNHHGIRL
jgi:hypothetical protein